MSWPIVKLGDVITFIRGITFKPEDQVSPFSDDSIVVMRTKNVQVEGLATEDLIAVPRSFVKRKEQVLIDSDILLSSANSWELVGKSSYVGRLKYEATAGGFISIVRAQHQKINPRYLFHWITTPKIQLAIRYCGRQTTNISNLDVERFKELEIPLPPLLEQKRIAAILDKADAIRCKRQQAIQLADEFLRSVFLDMFGDPVTNGWESVPAEALALDEKGSIRTGPFGSQLLHSEFTDRGIAVLGIDNAVSNTFCWAKPRYISEEKYQELKRYTVHPGDILITIMGTCGRTAIVPDDCPTAINTKHLCCITLDKEKCAPEFLHSYFLMHPVSKDYLSRTAKGAVMDGLNMGIIKELPVYLPPIEWQRKYSLIQKKILTNKNSIQLAQAGFEELFSSLSQKAFAGQL